MAKISKTFKQLTAGYAKCGLVPDQVAAQTKALLELYRDIAWAAADRSSELLAEGTAFSGVTEEGLMYLAAFAPPRQQIDFDERLEVIYRHQYTLEILDRGLQRVGRYPVWGEMYQRILSGQYTALEAVSVAALCDELAIERSTFYTRKKEAIALLGLVIFGFDLPALTALCRDNGSRIETALPETTDQRWTSPG